MKRKCKQVVCVQQFRFLHNVDLSRNSLMATLQMLYVESAISKRLTLTKNVILALQTLTINNTIWCLSTYAINVHFNPMQTNRRFSSISKVRDVIFFSE